MRPNLRVLIILMAAFALLSLQENKANNLEIIQKTTDYFKDPKFIEDFVASYGVLPGVEPPLSDEEREILINIKELRAGQGPKVAALQLGQDILNMEGKSNGSLVFNLGQFYLEMDNLAAAEKAYKMAIKKFPKYRRAHKNLGFLYLQQGKLDEASKPLQEALKLGDKSSTAFGGLANCYLSQNRLLAAESAFRQAFLLDPEKIEWRVGLIQVLVGLQKYNEASSMLDTLLSDSSISDQQMKKQFLLEQARCFIGSGEPMKAASNIEIVRHMGIADSATLSRLGNIYMKEKLFVPALGAYLAALEKSEKSEFNRDFNIAKILVEYEAFDEAAKYVSALEEKAELDRVQNLTLLTMRAKIFRAQGKNEDAIKILDDVINDDPLNGVALVELANYNVDVKNQSKARFYFDRAVQVPEVAYEANISYARMLVRAMKYQEALPIIKAARDIKDSKGMERYYLQVERRAKKASAAKAALEAQLEARS